MKREEILERIVSAKSEITSAEEAIGEVLRGLKISASGEEVSISKAVEDAFLRLRSARSSLAGLEKSLITEP